MIFIKRYIHIFVFCILCIPIHTNAGVFDWFSTKTKALIGFFSLRGAAQEQEPKSFFEWIRYRFFPISKHDLDESERKSKEHITQQREELGKGLNKEISAVKENVDDAGRAVDEAEKALKDVQQKVAERDAENTKLQQEHERLQEGLFTELQENAQAHKEEQLKKLKQLQQEHEEHAQKRRAELEELEKLLNDPKDGLGKKFEESQQQITEQLQQDNEQHMQRYDELHEQVKSLALQVESMAAGARQTAQTTQQIKKNIPKVEKTVLLLQRERARQQQYLEALLERCGKAADDNKYMMQVLFGVNQKFVLALKLMAMQQQGTAHEQEFALLQQQYLELLGTMGLLQEQRRQSSRIHEQPMTFRPLLLGANEHDKPMIDQEKLHNFMSETLRFPLPNTAHEEPNRFLPGNYGLEPITVERRPLGLVGFNQKPRQILPFMRPLYQAGVFPPFFIIQPGLKALPDTGQE